jgi:phospholipase C
LPKAAPPAAGDQVPARQEPGVRPARPLPYQPAANASVHTATGDVTLTLANSGAATLQLGVYPNGASSSRHDLAAGGRASVAVPAIDGAYDIAVYGANGFLREFAGKRGGSAVEVTVTVVGGQHGPRLRVAVHNDGRSAASVRVTGTRPGAGRATTYRVPAGTTVTTDRDVIGDGHGWYDVLATVDGDAAYRRRFAGHVENGEDTVTG